MDEDMSFGWWAMFFKKFLNEVKVANIIKHISTQKVTLFLRTCS
jgi:hypothetical protein